MATHTHHKSLTESCQLCIDARMARIAEHPTELIQSWLDRDLVVPTERHLVEALLASRTA